MICANQIVNGDDLIGAVLQQRRWIMRQMPRYEVRYNENEEWKEISELELMDGLYKLYHRVSPAIKEMLKGKELRTPQGDYRLKWKIGNPRRTQMGQRHLSPVQ